MVDTEAIKGRRGGHRSWLALRLAIELDEKLDVSVKNNRQMVSSTALETLDASSRITRGLLRT